MHSGQKCTEPCAHAHTCSLTTDSLRHILYIGCLQASQANVDMLASDLQAARHDQHTAQEQHAAAEQRASTWQAQAAGAARQLQALQAQLADLAARYVQGARGIWA